MGTQNLIGNLAPLAAVIVAVCGWFAVNWLNARRERANKRRDLRTNHLVNAFLTIARHGNRTTSGAKVAEVEAALAEIQLFGTNRQIAAARDVIAELVKGKAQIDGLLSLIRDDLRNDLKLEPAEGKFLWIVWPDGSRYSPDRISGADDERPHIRA
jgi:hypothetical protein